MDYEKAYKEAMEKVRSLHDNANEISKLIDLREELEDIFPELAESEDERIRKELIAAFQNGVTYNQISKARAKDYIAWLEKHRYTKKDIDDEYLKGICDAKHELEKLDEQKSAEKIEPKFNIGDVIKRGMLTLKVGSINFKKEFYELVKDNKVIHCIPFAEQDGWELVANNTTESPKHCVMADSSYCPYFKKQKPAEWSEEDETNLNDAIDACKAKYGNMSYTADWLKSLKYRVQPQPKQEWSEEDEQYLEDTLNLLEGHRSKNTYGDVVEWLKSLRPQSQWRPSDEQMEALKDIFARAGAFDDVLLSLINDLKKLKG